MNSQDTVVNVIINNILTCSKVATDVQIRFLVQTSVLHLKSTAAASTHRVAWGGVTAISDNRVNTNTTACNLCQWRFSAALILEMFYDCICRFSRDTTRNQVFFNHF